MRVITREDRIDMIFNVIVNSKEQIFKNQRETGKNIINTSSYVLDKEVAKAVVDYLIQEEGKETLIDDAYKEWNKRHHWWCILWQHMNNREPHDYDGICLHCKKDRYEHLIKGCKCGHT